MKYLIGKDDETNELIWGTKRDNDSNIAIETSEGRVFPCNIYNIIQLSKDTISVNNQSFKLDSVKVLSLDEALSKIGAIDDDFMVKDIDDKLPDPYKEDVPPLASAVILAITKNKIQHALTRSQHKRKLNIIRGVKETVVTRKQDITVGKAEELLNYYGLTLRDLFKPEYIVRDKNN